MDLDALIRRLLDRNIDMVRQITAEELLLLTQMAREMFQSQPVFLELLPPVVVCGDIHGQFDDLLRIFHQLGFPPNTNYLFLGDYVDRGPLSLETISLLFCFKLKYPGNIFLLRGNHETASTNEMYGFQHEIDQRYGRSDLCLWKAYNEAFAQMPISALIGERILCMHGGLSPYLRELDDLRKIKRGWVNPRELSLEMDLLWSDPEPNTSGWHQNTRGCSYTFGVDELTKAIALLDVDLVVRAHQVVQDGYEFEPETRKLITIFSAPNYCGEFDNCGAVMYVDQRLCCSFIQFRPIQ